ncbi:unnamed protein product [Rhizophagus irregularis]|uniref:Uncharacterized protein n=1 Tax=Rhizophagus irregularis TaxID=588596 RepID=A0A2N1N4X9_9GLOM|nr:hypothetical protein RhiirC2_781630 [Rhizophagus irregularis]CAB4389762.1 unnamed protein product [Rhizophagus irregularis]CAB5379585.1 unnamed protein product [Rhizophagus irregularis]
MNPSYDQMNSPTSAAFDIFFSGIIPIGYSTFFEPLLSAPLKSKVEDFILFFVEPLIPLFYALNKITYNQITRNHIIFIYIYCSFRIISFIIYYNILIWLKKNDSRYFKYKSLKHWMLFLYFSIIEFNVRFIPIILLENVRELLKIAFEPNAVFILGIIFAFLIYIFIIPHILYKNRDNFPIFSSLIYSSYKFCSFSTSIIFLVIIPSNVIYVKIAFNINLILVMRFFTIFEDKPSNKKRGLACVILFAFDDIHKIERELKNEEWDQDWYTSFLSHPMINRINRMIDKIKEIIKKKKIDDDNYYYNEEEDKSNCNKANILYYYKYGEFLEKRRIKKPCQKFIQDNESMISSSDNIIVIQDNENMSSSTENTIIKYNESTSSSENIITIQVHEFLLETYKPGIKLHDEIKKANKVYKLFNGIGIEKIYQVERFSVDDIERLEYKEIDEIIKNVRFCNF